jgi:plastocyanin
MIGAALGASTIAGCAGEAPAPSEVRAAADPAAVASESGSLYLEVLLRGEAPPAPIIAPDKNVERCGHTLADPVLLVSAGRVADAVAWLELESVARTPSSAEAPQELRLRSRDCQMEPRIQTAHRGARLTIGNGDAITHNPHGWLGDRTVFNVTLLDDEVQVTRTLRDPGVYRIDCDTHRWMRAFVHVFDHGWHGCTDADGGLRWGAVPAGSHTLHLWHEVLGEQALPVVVEPGREAVVRAEFELLDHRPSALIPATVADWIPRAPAPDGGSQ